MVIDVLVMLHGMAHAAKHIQPVFGNFWKKAEYIQSISFGMSGQAVMSTDSPKERQLFRLHTA